MQTIEYRVQFTGATNERGNGDKFWARSYTNPSEDLIRVEARNINAGYRKALKIALEPLGNGTRREIGGIEFSQVV